MKKIISLLMAVLMLCAALAVSASASASVLNLKGDLSTDTTYNDPVALPQDTTVTSGTDIVFNNKLTINIDATLTVDSDASVTTNGEICDHGKLVINPGGTFTFSGSWSGYKMIEVGGTLKGEWNSSNFTPLGSYITLSSDGRVEVKFKYNNPAKTFFNHLTSNGYKPTISETNDSEYPFVVTAGTPVSETTSDTVCDHVFGDDHVCTKCGEKDCALGLASHIWENGKCTVCELVCTHEGEFCGTCGMELTAAEEETASGDTASTLSEGNMTVVLCVACLAVGLVGGLLLGKKKKPEERVES